MSEARITGNLTRAGNTRILCHLFSTTKASIQMSKWEKVGGISFDICNWFNVRIVKFVRMIDL